MVRFLFLTIFSVFAYGQGWADLTNTHLGDVVPADGATFANFAWTGTPFHTNRYRVLTSWESCAVDTKRTRLLCQGDGHDGTDDNAVYSLDLVTRSASNGTSCGSATNCSTNASAPTVTRLNDPSMGGSGAWASVGCPDQIPANGDPIARQTYATLQYLPRSDSLWNYGTSDRCVGAFGTNGYGNPYVLPFNSDGSPKTWSKMTGGTAPNPAGSGTMCVYDSLYAGPEDALICSAPNTALYRYKIPTNYASNTAGDSWTLLSNTIVLQSGNSATPVLDPKRRMLYWFGPNFDGSNPRLISVMYDSPYTQTTLSPVGCGDMLAYTYPSLVYDPSIDRIVGYVPQTVASSGMTYPANAVNEIVIFDPATLTCVTQPQLGGAGPAAASQVLAASGAGQGSMGHFNYIAALGEYVLLLNTDVDAYSFKLNLTATHGLGSSTLTCIDQDGDGYGVGPGCTGPDADDQDSAVHTSAQFISKWTDIPTGLNHLGYAPENIWYMSPTGNDGTGAVNNAALPFATCCGAGKANPAAGDGVLYRSGNYTDLSVAPTGTIGSPILFGSYPGELATFLPGAGAAGIDLLQNQGYVVLDGFKWTGSGARNACIAGGENNNLVFRHIETATCANWGIDLQGDPVGQSGCPSTSCQPLNDITVEDSIFHDSAAQHGFYFSSHEDAVSKNIFVTRSIAYANNWNGWHFTGQFSNANFSQLITYNNGLSGYSWQNGTSNSYLSDSLSINDAQSMDLTLYDGSGTVCNGAPPYAVGTVCPYAQSNNLFTNLTFYLTGKLFDGTSNGHSYAATVGRQGGCTTTACTTQVMTGNKFQNIIFITNNTDGGSYASGSTYPPFQFPDNSGVTFLPNTTFLNVEVLDLANSGIISGYGPGASFGYHPLNCTDLAATAASSTNCLNSDPKFVSASTSFFNAPASFNLRLLAGSPAINSGTSAILPCFDVIGTACATTAPNLGAFEGSVGAPGGSSVSGASTLSGSAVIH